MSLFLPADIPDNTGIAQFPQVRDSLQKSYHYIDKPGVAGGKSKHPFRLNLNWKAENPHSFRWREGMKWQWNCLFSKESEEKNRIEGTSDL